MAAERGTATERDSCSASGGQHARTLASEPRGAGEERRNSATQKTQSREKRRQEGSPTECLRQCVEAVAAELSASETAVYEQEAIITQLQRSYNQQRCDLRAQLGLGPDEDDADDVRHAKKVQGLQQLIQAAEVGMRTAAPDLERYEADVVAAKQARDALAAESLDTAAAIKALELRHERLQTELPNIRSRCSQQEGQLLTQRAKLAEMEAAAVRAQEKREAAQAAAAANKTASRVPTDAADSLLELLRSRLAGKSTAALHRALACYVCLRLCVSRLHAASFLACLFIQRSPASLTVVTCGFSAVGETLHTREREVGALTRTVARERAERALLAAAIDGCRG